MKKFSVRQSLDRMLYNSLNESKDYILNELSHQIGEKICSENKEYIKENEIVNPRDNSRLTEYYLTVYVLTEEEVIDALNMFRTFKTILPNIYKPFLDDLKDTIFKR